MVRSVKFVIMKTKYSLNSFRLLRFMFLILLLFQVKGWGQISSGEIKPTKVEKVKGERSERVKRAYEADTVAPTLVYLTGAAQYSYRKFEDLSVYSIYTQEREEKSTYNGGVALGMIMPLNNRLSIDAGLSYFGQGEVYQFEDALTDSSFSYRNVYDEVGIPLKLRCTFGNRFQLYGYAGLMPVNILAIRRTSVYSKPDGSVVDLGKSLVKEGFTAFNLVALGGLGVNYFINAFGFHLSAGYTRHLMNTYSENTFKRTHFMYGIGLNLGIQVKI